MLKLRCYLGPAVALLLAACAIRPVAGGGSTPPPVAVTRVQVVVDGEVAATATVVEAVDVALMTQPGAGRASRLPDLSALGDGWYPLWYVLQAGEDLGIIAVRFGLSYDQIRQANNASSGQLFQRGDTIIVPQRASRFSPATWLIPDSELVYGPGAVEFDTLEVVRRQRGYLARYSERVDGVELSGGEIVARVAANYSVNPRLLLVLLDYHSGWLTGSPAPDSDAALYPMAYAEGGSAGLFRQLAWAAGQLNRHFYNWRVGRLSLLILGDGTRVALHPELNAGTAAVQALLAQTHTADGWGRAFERGGVADVYNTLFGDPFDYAVEPLLPPDLIQPDFVLPWPRGETWYYVGGPHAAFGSGTPWGAVDFAPPDDNVGCYVSGHQITSVAAGVVARTGFGQVVLDLDGDGYEQTGWAVVYLHVDDATKVGDGFEIERGGYIGLPSCDGGEAEGTHVHVARKYNGVWLLADDSVPFQLGGWVVGRGDAPYSGTLISAAGEAAREACDCRNDALNGVLRE